MPKNAEKKSEILFPSFSVLNDGKFLCGKNFFPYDFSIPRSWTWSSRRKYKTGWTNGQLSKRRTEERKCCRTNLRLIITYVMPFFYQSSSFAFLPNSSLHFMVGLFERLIVFFYQLIDCSVDPLIVRLMDWLIDWLFGWLIDWLAAEFVESYLK